MRLFLLEIVYKYVTLSNQINLLFPLTLSSGFLATTGLLAGCSGVPSLQKHGNTLAQLTAQMCLPT